jgi:hypothetical protein
VGGFGGPAWRLVQRRIPRINPRRPTSGLCDRLGTVFPSGGHAGECVAFAEVNAKCFRPCISSFPPITSGIGIC